jgi:hypothetical protein
VGSRLKISLMSCYIFGLALGSINIGAFALAIGMIDDNWRFLLGCRLSGSIHRHD